MNKKYIILRTKEKCQRFTVSIRKKIEIIRRNKKKDKKKKNERGEQKKSVLSDLRTVRQGWRSKSHLC